MKRNRDGGVALRVGEFVGFSMENVCTYWGKCFFFDFLGLCLLNKFVVMYWKGLFFGDVFHFVGFVDTRYMEFFVERGRPSFFRGAFKREKKYGFSEGIGFRFFGYCF